MDDSEPVTVRSPSLLYKGLHPFNPCNYIDYYSFTDPGDWLIDWGVTALSGQIKAILCLFQPQMDGRLSWPNWLTYSGHFTHNCVFARLYFRVWQNNKRQYCAFSNPRWMEGWVGLIDWPTVDTLPTKWSPTNHRLGKPDSQSQMS